LRFSDETWVDVLNLITESIDNHVEVGAQLCEVDGAVRLGRKVYGSESGIIIPEGFFDCDEGKWVGDLHVETRPKFPPYPSEEDIENDFRWVSSGMRTEPYKSCICSWDLDPPPRMGVMPEETTFKAGCSCEEWGPLSESQKKRIFSKEYPRFMGMEWFAVRQDLKDMGVIRDRELQWEEAPMYNGRFSGESVTKHEEFG